MDQTHPEAEVHIDAALAEALLLEQCPELLDPPVRVVDEGWDNVTFRISALHALRLPRREIAVELLRNEQKWLPELAGWIPLPVPRPVFLGEPSERFPWTWSVVDWVPGSTVEGRPLDQAAATTMADTLRALHRPAPADAPGNPFRGLPLAARREVVEARLNDLGLHQLARAWSRALDAPPSTRRVWIHGDLHPRNVLVREGRLSGIIDWGDLCAGDPATDLACAWTLFEASERDAFLTTYGASDAEIDRAAGWAVNFGSGLLASGEPRHVPMGWDIVRRLSNERRGASG